VKKLINIVHKENAVSPVIGILLMLVVTIIIAAVVSGFAGGLAVIPVKAPQLVLLRKRL
jgi:flagellin-like protein